MNTYKIYEIINTIDERMTISRALSNVFIEYSSDFYVEVRVLSEGFRGVTKAGVIKSSSWRD